MLGAALLAVGAPRFYTRNTRAVEGKLSLLLVAFVFGSWQKLLCHMLHHQPKTNAMENGRRHARVICFPALRF